MVALPGDVPFEQMLGPAGFGARMAWVDGELAVGGGGVLRWSGQEWAIDALRGLWPGPQGPRVATGTQVLDLVSGEVLYEGTIEVADGLGERVVVASGTELWVDGRVEALAGVREIEVGEAGILLLRCEGAQCWTEVDGVVLGDGGEGGALAWQGDRAIWGMPQLGVELGQGQVRDADGAVMDGVAGEHLGQGICPDFAVGEHNLHARPNQSRIRSLHGTSEVAIATGQEGGGLVLACDAEGLAMAQPTWLEGGRVWILARSELP